MKTPLVLAAVLIVVVAGCGGSDSVEVPTQTRPTKTITLPEGVTLTKPGTSVKVGKSATFVVDVGDGSSAVTATVTKVKRGKIKDLRFFTLDAQAKKRTPYYVSATVTNRGPAGLGGIAPPFSLRDSKDSVAGPNTLNGEFKPCSPRTMPPTLLPGKSTRICMVFLMEPGTKVASVDAVTDGTDEPVSWKP